jgi:hypothetical protein
MIRANIRSKRSVARYGAAAGLKKRIAPGMDHAAGNVIRRETMKRLVLAACACLLAAPVAAQTSDADKKTARAMVEDHTKTDFEELKSKISQRDNDAMDALKMLFYNKAYIYYACIVSVGREKFSDKTIADCAREPMTELMAGFNKAKEYSKNPKAETCATKARLATAEADFPPYDFLAGDDVHLYDFKAMRTCLTSR